MLRAVRRFFAERDVLEVHTPVLGRHTVTDPAIESLRTEDERHLQTSPEFHMKRLLAAGAPSIFQICPAFRSGEQGRWHNPEFTMIEWYRLDFDAERLRAEVAALVDALLGPADYEQRSYAEVLRTLDVDVETLDESGLVDAARSLGLAAATDAAQARAFLFDLALRSAPHAAPRLFVTPFPASEAALAKLNAQGAAERFELVVGGVEVANGYHELTDAEELERRMAADVQRRRALGLRAVAPDAALVGAQRAGLPNCAGVAMGFDRLLALKLGCDGIGETLAFDWQRA